MAVTLALAGDTMLGRQVADRIVQAGPAGLFADEVVALTTSADLTVLNLECCISEGGERWPDPGKPFFFRAPPAAVETLLELGVDAVTLANNHALDYGPDALIDTIELLDGAGIAHTGAGRDLAEARRPARVRAPGCSVAVVGFTDHPTDFAAGPQRAGVAHADLRHGLPAWIEDLIAGEAAGVDLVVATPHWGPNMTASPVPHVRRAAAELAGTGAGLVAGHSAHVFHGVGLADGVPLLYDLGDLIDDYAVDPQLRNDLGLLWLVTVEGGRPQRLEAVPLALDHAFTRPATGDDLDTIHRSFVQRCGALGVPVRHDGDRLVVDLVSPPEPHLVGST